MPFAGQKKFVDRYEFVLASGQVAVEGTLAFLDTATGTVKNGATSTTLIPIGFFSFAGSIGVAGTVTGDGVAKVTVQLFKPIHVFAYLNDSSSITLIGVTAYSKTSTSVTGVSTGASSVGIVFEIEGTFVWVDHSRFAL